MLNSSHSGMPGMGYMDFFSDIPQNESWIKHFDVLRVLETSQIIVVNQTRLSLTFVSITSWPRT